MNIKKMIKRGLMPDPNAVVEPPQAVTEKKTSKKKTSKKKTEQ